MLDVDLFDGSSSPDLIDKALNGNPITIEEGEELWNGLSLPEMGKVADSVRQRLFPGRVVTFLIDRNINYTNVCNADCSFCGFYRPSPKHPEAYVLSKEELAKKIEETLAVGGTRILLQGGHNDDLDFGYYIDLVRWISQNFDIEINAFSPSEIVQITEVSGLSCEEVLRELKQAGMKGLPGGGGEILDDEIRKRVSPKKIMSDEWIGVMEIAHTLDLTTTATMVIGFGETIEHRLNHLERVRSLQSRSHSAGHEGFSAFISWPLQHNDNTSLGRSKFATQYGTGSVEYLRWAAFARIYLQNVPHHQASWPSCGPDVAAVALHMGCDDFGSTMLEENVVSKAGGHTAKEPMMTPERLMWHIRRAKFVPAQRDSSFNIVKRYSE